MRALTAANTRWNDDEDIWDFGTNEHLPVLRSLPAPGYYLTPAPASVTATVLGFTAMRISWDRVSDVTSYQVHDSSGLVTIINHPTTSYTAKYLSPNTEYTYRVRACGFYGCSAFASASAITTPVIIRNAAELAAISTDRVSLNGVYALAGDIDLSDYGNWKPIGTRNRPFTGNFDGNGYNIGGVSSSGYEFAGLFGYVKGASISNLGVVVGNISSSSSYVGGLAGGAYNSQISNSYATGGSVSGDSDVGGLVGWGNSAVITSSYAAVSSVSGRNGVGGLVGYGRYSTIKSSYAAVDSVSGTGDFVGGLVGSAYNSEISNSYAAVNSISGDNSVGGLVGYRSSSTITESYWDSSTSGITKGDYGLPKTTAQLRMPTNFGGSIYANWYKHKCDDGSRAWNLGTIFQYPALTCTPGELITQHSYAVTGLRFIPDDSSATLSWNNPDASIASISISYQRTGSNDVRYLLPIKDKVKITPNTNNVQETISGLTNGEYYTFTVDLTLSGIYAGREGAAPSITVAISPDFDGDGLSDFLDADDDGDGLIEIATAEQLNQVRHNLSGSSFISSAGGEGGTTECGGLIGITECNGYELVANISLADYGNWEPIGSCPAINSNNICTDEDELFNAIFDGNGYTISNLTITNSNGDYDNAAGLFGVISPASILRNINIRSANISGGGRNLGLLVGYAKGAKIMNSSVVGEVTASGVNIGGLVGNGEDASITLSYVKDSSVRGDDNVGSLVGLGEYVITTSSYADGVSVRGDDAVGGLVGFGQDAYITLSYVKGGYVNGDDDVGGLVGFGRYAIIGSSYAVEGTVSGDDNIGGLVGDGRDMTMSSSYAAGSSVSGITNVGGLVGNGNGLTTVSRSYWDSSITISGRTGGSFGLPKTTAQLQNPTNSVGIYATWTTTCADGSRAWDFGTAFQYPALTCTSGSTAAQRIFDIDGDGVNNAMDAFPTDPAESVDTDGDRVGDNTDIDADGNGLIEIATAEQLNQIRHNLLGSSLKASAVDADADRGCGNGKDIKACNGYELVANISLADYADWQPIGSCPAFDANACTDVSALFNAAFDGNSYTISNLTIINEEIDYVNASGLFGTISSTSILRNIHIRSANISGGANNVGMLVGYAEEASIIINSSAAGEVTGTANNVGGLVGNGDGAIITSSYVAGGSVSGADYVGGLVGSMDVSFIGFGRSFLEISDITSSYVSAVSVSGDNYVGGLVGWGVGGTFTLSYVAGSSVNGSYNVGGLVGNGLSATITSSYAADGSVSGDSSVGNLIGDGSQATITSSYAVNNKVSGRNYVGGLVGVRNYASNGFSDGFTDITASYWNGVIRGITTNKIGEYKTTSELQTPTDSVGIYATWDEECDDGSLAWDFGTASQYPALTCTPGGVEAQRP